MGGDGGGRLRIDAQTVILDGTIRANGTNGVSGCCAGGGSGGSIRLDVGTLSGGGSISANGGASSSSTNSGGGGGGRVALRYDDATGFDLSLVEARGGAGLNDGGAGTVFLKDPIQLIGDLKVIDGGSDTPLLADVTVDRFDITDARVVGNAIDTNTLEIQSSVLIINDIRAGSLRVTSSSVINATQTTTTTESALVIDADTLEVDATSSIDVSGAGYLGAHSGGNGSSNGRTLGNASGSTRRNGGSHAGLGGAGTAPATPNAVYGDFQDPSDLGSGGGSDLGVGGDGGGRLRIDAQTVILDGTIRANGTNGVSGCCAGGGSGGSIRLDVGTLSGGGSISANGGASSSSTNSGGGGGGRVALRYDDATGFDLSLVEARGGAGLNDGGAGTVFLKDNAQPLGALRLDNESFVQPQPTPLHSLGQGQSTALTPTTLTDAAASFVPGALRGLELNPNLNQSATFTILDNDATTISIDPLDGDMTAVAAANDSYSGEIVVDTLLIDGRALVTLLDGNAAHTDRTATITATELRIRGSSSLTHPDATTSQQFGLRLRVLDTLEVDSTSSIDVRGAGYLGAFSGGNGSSNGRTLGNASGSTRRNGGSHAGLGGFGNAGGSVNPAYGDPLDPSDPGSGGGSDQGVGGDGGGTLRIDAQTVILDGTIRANGTNGVSGCCAGGGSGGSIRLDVGTLSGGGSISANGGASSSSTNSGGGGGGRIAVYYSDASGFNLLQIVAPGGTGFNAGGLGSVELVVV